VGQTGEESLSHRTRGYPISGGSDAPPPTVLDLIKDAALCIDCLVTRTKLPQRRVERVLDWARDVTGVVSRPGRCDACGSHRIVHRIA
jgi:hypothetical protein